MHNMTIYDNVALHSPRNAQRLLRSYRIRPAQSTSELSNKLKKLTSRHGEKALNELAKIHPDRELILNGADIKLSADGEVCACPTHGNFNGSVDSDLGLRGDISGSGFREDNQEKEESKLTLKNFVMNNQNTLLIAGTVIVGLAIIYRKNK